MMRCRRFLIFILLFMMLPLDIYALDILDFRYTNNNSLYDLANLYDDTEEDSIIHLIQKFHCFSDLDLLIITVNSLEEKNTLSREFSDTYIEGLNKEKLITFIVVRDEEKAYINCVGKKFFWISLKKFKMNGIKSSGKYVSNFLDLVNILQDFIWYYVVKDLEILVSVLVLTMIITFLIVRKIRKRYDISLVSDAQGYYDDTTIQFVNK